MGMTIDDLKAYCMEEEATHRLRCKQYDDASGYTRSKNKDIRTASAVREELWIFNFQCGFKKTNHMTLAK